MTERTTPRALIVYFTKTGHTLDAANYVAEGLKSAGVDADVVDVEEVEDVALDDYAAVAVGSPCHAGSIPMAPGVSIPVKVWIEGLPEGCCQGKRGAAFSVHSWTGGQRTVSSLEASLVSLGAEVPATGVAVKAGVPFSLWRGPEIKDEDADRLRNLGEKLGRSLQAC